MEQTDWKKWFDKAPTRNIANLYQVLDAYLLTVEIPLDGEDFRERDMHHLKNSLLEILIARREAHELTNFAPAPDIAWDTEL